MSHPGAVKADMFDTDLSYVIFDIKAYVVSSADVRKWGLFAFQVKFDLFFCAHFYSLSRCCFQLLRGFRASALPAFLQQHLLFLSFLTLFLLSGFCFVFDAGFQQTWI